MTQADSQSDVSDPPPAPASESVRPAFSKDELVRRGYEFAHRALEFGERSFHRTLGRMAAVTPEGSVGGLCGMMASLPFTPETILFGYAQGLFPMETRGSIVWNCPDPRCVVPLDKLHVPSRVARYLKKGLFELRFDSDPAEVLANCADRTETWLSHRVQRAYLSLFELGALHTIAAYSSGRLVGGAFGIALGSVCTIESMFSHEDHASKLCFAQMCMQLVECGFTLADCQYMSPHVERFGAIEMPRAEYRERVARGLIRPAQFRLPTPVSPAKGKPAKANAAKAGPAKDRPAKSSPTDRAAPISPAPSGPEASGPAPSSLAQSGPETSGPVPSGPETSGPVPSGPETSSAAKSNGHG
jgi:leucyl/phenylalanyl-tRNA---protein transferase